MREFFVSDSHTDLLTCPFCVKGKKGKSYFDCNDFSITKAKVIKYLSDKNIDTISLAVFTRDKNISLKDLRLFKDIVEHYNNLELGKALLTIEDMFFVKNFYDLENIVKLKPFSCTLTWNFDNQFGGGSFGKSGLTEFGKFTIEYLEGNNILIDTAHINRKSFKEFIDITTKPIFNSHTNIYSLFKHKRNLLDREIKTIVDSNGYMGITLYDKFIKGKEIDSYDIARQFNYLVENFGIDNFGLGTDFFGIDKINLPVDIDSYNELYKVADSLFGFGYNAKDIEKLMNKNFSDFVKRVEKIKIKKYFHILVDKCC